MCTRCNSGMLTGVSPVWSLTCPAATACAWAHVHAHVIPQPHSMCRRHRWKTRAEMITRTIIRCAQLLSPKPHTVRASLAPCAPLAPVRAHTPLTCNPLPSKHTHSPLPVYTCHPFFVVRAPLHSLVTALLLRCARSMVTRTSQAHSVDDVGCMEEMGGGGLPASSRAACVCGW